MDGIAPKLQILFIILGFPFEMELAAKHNGGGTTDNATHFTVKVRRSEIKRSERKKSQIDSIIKRCKEKYLERESLDRNC